MTGALHDAADEIERLRKQLDEAGKAIATQARTIREQDKELERMRAPFIAAMEVVQRERTRIAYNAKGAPPAVELGYADIMRRLDAVIAQADAALGSER
jgi:hypothetical protein